jgi:hypothetical protein
MVEMKELIAEVRKHLAEEFNRQLSDDDLVRFIVARKRNIAKATTMAMHFCEWYDKPIAGHEHLSPRTVLFIHMPDPNEDIYRQYFPHSNLGHAKNGCPVYWEKSGVCSKNFHTVNKLVPNESMVIRHIRQQEFVFQDRCQRASQFFNRSISKQIIVFDLKNLTYTLDTHAISVFRQSLSIDEAYYPERLDHLFMINAPWFFTAIWSMLRPWIDPITAEKIMIIGSDYLPTLRKYIDDSQIPAELGGLRENFAWTFPDNHSETDDFLSLAAVPTPKEAEDSHISS